MESKYLRVASYIREMMEEGRLKPGHRAPSIRDMCKRFGCSKATAIRAYEELQREHILYSRPRSGFYAVEQDIGSYGHEDGILDFSSAGPSPEQLPYREFEHCLNQAVRIYKESLFGYSDIQGLEAARKAIKQHLMDFQIFAEIDTIFVTAGSQQGLYVLSQMPFPNGKRNVLVEQPVYYGMIKALEVNGVTALGIERGSYGFDLEKLERLFGSGDIKFFYLTPRFQNPTGFSLDTDQKRKILSLALKYDVYIVEDDYLGDLERDTRADTMYSLDLSGRVIYLKSFSKTLLPGLRLGAAVLPYPLTKVFKKYKACCDLYTNTVSQGALEVFIKSGIYDAHVRKLKNLYESRMKVLKNTLNTLPELLRLFKYIPSSGLFCSFGLPGQLKARETADVLMHKKILVTDAGMMFLPGFEKRNMIRLSILRVNEEEIIRGLRLMNGVIQSCPGK